MWDSPIHVLILLILFLAICIGVPVTFYGIGKKVGDAVGYARGLKEGQQKEK